jgi:beta-glucosidase
VALDHSARQCEGLLDAGVQPVVTFHHFTTPLWLADQGGWESDDMPERFGAFCEKAATRLAT